MILELIKDNLGSIIGTVVPVLGSVFLIHYSNSVDSKNKHKMLFRRACELLKYNLEIAYSRIVNGTDQIEFSVEELRDVISDMESVGMSRSKEYYNDLFELVFMMRTGEQLLIHFGEFYRMVFEQTRKSNANFLELAKIIDSVGVDQVHEFKVLRQLIYLTRKMDVHTYFDDYSDLVKSVLPDIDTETCIRYFIVELVEQKHRGISNRLSFVSYALENGIVKKAPEIRFRESGDDRQVEVDKICKEFSYYQDIISYYHRESIWQQ